jgi:Terminase large subunit, T4likevirus-type, N-terminal
MVSVAIDFASALADRLDPPEPDVFGALGYVPTPKQQVFHDATEFSVLFGGSAGGGKSRALTAEAIRACVRHPGIRVGAFRRTYPELRESLIAELAQMGFASALGASWNSSAFELRFPNGSLLMFRYAETIQDATRRQGGQYQLLVFDERTLTPGDVIAFLESRLRSGRADIPVLGIRSSANPGGASHGEVKDTFITKTNYGQKVAIDSRGRTIRFIPSRLSDNPHVNPEYAADLQALPPKMRAAFLDGNWDVFAGQVFPELSRERHVISPMALPASWLRYNGIDWGFGAPWGVLWAAIDPDGRAWFYRELYSAGVGEADQAQRILAAEAGDEHVVTRFADDAMWNVVGDAKVMADVYAENGVYLTKAGKGPGSRVTGWQRIRSYLAEKPACPHHRALGWDSCPGMHIFSTCENFYRTLADLPHATAGNPEDADTKSEDHLPDCARYLLINLGTGPDFPLLGDIPGQSIAEQLQPLGQFAVRQPDDGLPWAWGDDDEPRPTVQRSPWA